MRGIKDRGLNAELRPLMKRVRRSISMERIDLKTGQQLLSHLETAEMIIETMEEEEADGQ